MTNCEFGVYYWVQLQETGLEEMKLWYQFLFPKLLELNFFWNWDFRVHTLLMMLITDVFQLVIYVTLLFWDDTSSFNFAWFCVWFVILRARRGIGVVSHGSKQALDCLLILRPVDGECFVLKFIGDLVKVDQWCYLCILFHFRGFQRDIYYFHMTL